MKKLIIFSVILCSLPLSMQAQDDDMYFVPSKKKEVANTSSYSSPKADTYYSGSNRSVDDYNRRSQSGWSYNGSSYQVISGDSTMKDVITFTPVEGVYPDSTAEFGDFALTREMTRWEGYTPTDAYWEGYDRGRSDEWSASVWHSPWYYSSYYPWYDRWYYDPWYPSWTWSTGWYYDPWYYRPYHYYGWGWRGYYGGHHGGYYGHTHRNYRPNTVFATRTRGYNGNNRISSPGSNRISGTRGTFGNSRTAGNRISSPSSSSRRIPSGAAPPLSAA